jgi:hypothetical protein
MARRRIERKATAVRTVTVRLHGYPAYERAISGHHPACWLVDLVFQAEGQGFTQSLTYLQTEDYDEAFAKYEILRVICR